VVNRSRLRVEQQDSTQGNPRVMPSLTANPKSEFRNPKSPAIALANSA